MGEGDKTDKNPETFIILKADGTAEYTHKMDLRYVYNYTWNTDKKEIYMKVEKKQIEDKLMDYKEVLQYTNSEKFRESLKEFYEEFYPNGNSFEQYFSDIKEDSVTTFSTQATYGYEVRDGKMTITEKFTGISNMLDSHCSCDKEGTHISIWNTAIRVNMYDKTEQKYIDYLGNFGDGNSVVLKDCSGEKDPIQATYKIVDNEMGTITVTFGGKDYVCEFEGQTFTQVD